MNPAATPIGDEITLHDGAAPIGMGNDVGRRKNGDMFTRRVRAHAKQERIAGFGLAIRDFAKPCLRGLTQSFFSSLLRPIRRIRRRGDGFRAVKMMIDPANQAETVTSSPALACLMLIRRIKPTLCLGEDARLNIAHL